MRINYTEGHNLQRSKGQISVKGSRKTMHLVDLRKKVSNLFPKVDFVLYFVLVCLFASLIFTLLAFLLFKAFFSPQSSGSIILIGNVNILTNSVGLLYLGFSQMYNVTPPRQPASPHHLRLLSLELITRQRIMQCFEIRNWNTEGCAYIRALGNSPKKNAHWDFYLVLLKSKRTKFFQECTPLKLSVH